MPIHYDTIEDGQNKQLHLLFFKYYTSDMCNQTLPKEERQKGVPGGDLPENTQKLGYRSDCFLECKKHSS